MLNPNCGAGILRSGRRLSEEPPEIASSDLPLIPQLTATTEPDSDTTYVPPSEEPVSDAPLTVYESDPPGFIESHNELYAAEKDVEEIERRNAATEELVLALRRSPELCREVLATVHYETKGWCKLATKQANVCLPGCQSTVLLTLTLAIRLCTCLLGRVWRP